jgi:hypothetical protein
VISKSQMQASRSIVRRIGNGFDAGAEAVLKETLQLAFYASEDRSSSTLTMQVQSTYEANLGAVDARIMPRPRSTGGDKITKVSVRSKLKLLAAQSRGCLE